MFTPDLFNDFIPQVFKSAWMVIEPWAGWIIAGLVIGFLFKLATPKKKKGR